jgi:signal transduction histidine kinase
MNQEILLKRETLAKEICAQLNNFVDLQNTLSLIIQQIKEMANVEAISIRLFEEGDYPYFVHEGFPESFIKAENSILAHKTHDASDSNESLQLDCLCGKVIRGNVDSLKDYYTEKGSYYTNNSSENTASLLANETDVNIRNHCNACGYESVGLFPIKSREEKIGLIQLNDKRQNVFTQDLVEFMEMIGEQIGTAVENAMLYDKLKLKNTELENSVGRLSEMQDQLLEAKKMTALADMVAGMAHEIYAPLSQAFSSTSESLRIAYDLAEKDTGYFSEINSLSLESKKALKQIEDVQALIRSFKSIAIDQFQESRQLINLKVFINDVIKVLKPSLPKIEVNYTIYCADKIEFMSYSGALSQILSQLIHNSYQHGFKTNKGEIIITCSVASGFIKIVYSDNGRGLEPGIKHKIFEPFFSTQRKHNSGLGLTIAKNLTETKLNGSIEVSTSIDEGVEFTLRFPY